MERGTIITIKKELRIKVEKRDVAEEKWEEE